MHIFFILSPHMPPIDPEPRWRPPGSPMREEDFFPFFFIPSLNPRSPHYTASPPLDLQNLLALDRTLVGGGYAFLFSSWLCRTRLILSPSSVLDRLLLRGSFLVNASRPLFGPFYPKFPTSVRHSSFSSRRPTIFVFLTNSCFVWYLLLCGPASAPC